MHAVETRLPVVTLVAAEPPHQGHIIRLHTRRVRATLTWHQVAMLMWRCVMTMPTWRWVCLSPLMLQACGPVLPTAKLNRSAASVSCAASAKQIAPSPQRTGSFSCQCFRVDHRPGVVKMPIQTTATGKRRWDPQVTSIYLDLTAYNVLVFRDREGRRYPKCLRERKHNLTDRPANQ